VRREERREKSTLLVYIDDATSGLLWLEFVTSESLVNVMIATKNYMQKHGRPHALYVDFGSAFSVNLNNLERDKKTQWERCMEELSVIIHHAHSPQAKGRVERVNKTLQDRLIKELRLVGISNIGDANKFLLEGDFIAKHNQHFSVPAAQNGNAHRSINEYNLDEIFCLQEKRILGNDFTVSYNKRIFQITANQDVRPKDIIIVKTYLNDSVALFMKNCKLNYNEIAIRKPRQEEKKLPQRPSLANPLNQKKRRFNPGLGPVSRP
jgi:hypothetical protein